MNLGIGPPDSILPMPQFHFLKIGIIIMSTLQGYCED